MSLKLNSSGGGSITLQEPSTASNRTLTLPDNTGNLISSADSGTVSQAMLGAGVAGNGPAFSAYNSTTQSFSAGVYTKVTYNVENFDTNNNYNNGTYAFTPTVAGYYQVNASVGIGTGLNNSFLLLAIYKNGASVFYSVTHQSLGAGASVAANGMFYMNGSTDYLEVYLYPGYLCNAAGGTGSTVFSAALVRSA